MLLANWRQRKLTDSELKCQKFSLLEMQNSWAGLFAEHELRVLTGLMLGSGVAITMYYVLVAGLCEVPT